VKLDTWLHSSKPPGSTLNFGFFMDRMTSAARAKFLNGKLFSLALFVFGRHIIAPFTSVALQSD
jgi:hypothetical protein